MASKLTQEKLDKKNWIDDNQCCIAKYKDELGILHICGDLYANHRSSEGEVFLIYILLFNYFISLPYRLIKFNFLYLILSIELF